MPFYCIRDHKTQPIKSNKCAHVLHGMDGIISQVQDFDIMESAFNEKLANWPIALGIVEY